MRLVFAGTPEFSVAALENLVAAGHEVVGVFSQPDRPAGRGRKLTPSAVAQKADALGIPVFKPQSFKKEPDAVEQLRQLTPDCMIVVAFGMILPQSVLDIPTHGCLNIHASLLPRWRGAAPIARAILAGDRESGITIMRMDAGLDTGPMLLTQRTGIDASTTAGELHDQLSALGAKLIVDAVSRLENGPVLEEATQPEIGANYASKLSKSEARIDWSNSAEQLRNHVHGFNPEPGAWTLLEGKRLKLHRAEVCEEEIGPASGCVPGTILACDHQGMVIACGHGELRTIELQREGAKPAAPLAAFGGRPPIGATLT